MTKRVLSICGGGIFGLIPALVLTEFEKRPGMPVYRMFDLIAGTSTGGILAAGLALGIPAAQLAALYRDNGRAIFHASFQQTLGDLWGLAAPKYSAAPLEAYLEAVLGEKTLADALTHLLMPASRVMPTVDAFFFRSWHGPNFAMKDAARATSAAPYYFPPAELLAIDGEAMTFCDGGLFANDPEDCALLEARAIWPTEEIQVISLGTGYEPVTVHAKPGWGAADWMPHLVDVVLGTGEAAAARRAQLLTSARVRLDAPISGDMDDASPANVAAMTAAASNIIASADFAAALDLLAEKAAA